MNCKNDALPNVLIDNGPVLNVIPKSTLSKLKYQGSPMRPSGIIVKAFDGSRNSVIGEVDLPIHIGPHLFHITFQVMDIFPTYSCLTWTSSTNESVSCNVFELDHVITFYHMCVSGALGSDCFCESDSIQCVTLFLILFFLNLI